MLSTPFPLENIFCFQSCEELFQNLRSSFQLSTNGIQTKNPVLNMFPVRRELVGKRFAFIHGDGRSGTRHRGSLSGLQQNWNTLTWVTGTILATNVEALDTQNESVVVKKVKVFIEYDGKYQRPKEWIKLYSGNHRIFLVEENLVLCRRSHNESHAQQSYPWPALRLVPILDRNFLDEHPHLIPVEYMGARKQLSFVVFEDILQLFPNEDQTMLLQCLQQDKYLKADYQKWERIQKTQMILLYGPYSLTGCRVEIIDATSGRCYRAVIISHDYMKRILDVMDDQLLKSRKVNPKLIQINFLASDEEIDKLMYGQAPKAIPTRYSRYGHQMEEFQKRESSNASLNQFTLPQWMTNNSLVKQDHFQNNQRGQQEFQQDAPLACSQSSRSQPGHSQSGYSQANCGQVKNARPFSDSRQLETSSMGLMNVPDHGRQMLDLHEKIANVYSDAQMQNLHSTLSPKSLNSSNIPLLSPINQSGPGTPKYISPMQHSPAFITNDFSPLSCSVGSPANLSEHPVSERRDTPSGKDSTIMKKFSPAHNVSSPKLSDVYPSPPRLSTSFENPLFAVDRHSQHQNSPSPHHQRDRTLEKRHSTGQQTSKLERSYPDYRRRSSLPEAFKMVECSESQTLEKSPDFFQLGEGNSTQQKSFAPPLNQLERHKHTQMERFSDLALERSTNQLSSMNITESDLRNFLNQLDACFSSPVRTSQQTQSMHNQIRNVLSLTPNQMEHFQAVRNMLNTAQSSSEFPKEEMLTFFQQKLASYYSQYQSVDQTDPRIFHDMYERQRNKHVLDQFGMTSSPRRNCPSAPPMHLPRSLSLDSFHQGVSHYGMSPPNGPVKKPRAKRARKKPQETNAKENKVDLHLKEGVKEPPSVSEQLQLSTKREKSDVDGKNGRPFAEENVHQIENKVTENASLFNADEREILEKDSNKVKYSGDLNESRKSAAVKQNIAESNSQKHKVSLNSNDQVRLNSQVDGIESVDHQKSEMSLSSNAQKLTSNVEGLNLEQNIGCNDAQNPNVSLSGSNQVVKIEQKINEKDMSAKVALAAARLDGGLNSYSQLAEKLNVRKNEEQKMPSEAKWFENVSEHPGADIVPQSEEREIDDARQQRYDGNCLDQPPSPEFLPVKEKETDLILELEKGQEASLDNAETPIEDSFESQANDKVNRCDKEGTDYKSKEWDGETVSYIKKNEKNITKNTGVRFETEWTESNAVTENVSGKPPVEKVNKASEVAENEATIDSEITKEQARNSNKVPTASLPVSYLGLKLETAFDVPKKGEKDAKVIRNIYGRTLYSDKNKGPSLPHQLRTVKVMQDIAKSDTANNDLGIEQKTEKEIKESQTATQSNLITQQKFHTAPGITQVSKSPLLLTQMPLALTEQTFLESVHMLKGNETEKSLILDKGKKGSEKTPRKTLKKKVCRHKRKPCKCDLLESMPFVTPEGVLHHDQTNALKGLPNSTQGHNLSQNMLLQTASIFLPSSGTELTTNAVPDEKSLNPMQGSRQNHHQASLTGHLDEPSFSIIERKEVIEEVEPVVPVSITHSCAIQLPPELIAAPAVTSFTLVSENNIKSIQKTNYRTEQNDLSAVKSKVREAGSKGEKRRKCRHKRKPCKCETEAAAMVDAHINFLRNMDLKKEAASKTPVGMHALNFDGSLSGIMKSSSIPSDLPIGDFRTQIQSSYESSITIASRSNLSNLSQSSQCVTSHTSQLPSFAQMTKIMNNADEEISQIVADINELDNQKKTVGSKDKTSKPYETKSFDHKAPSQSSENAVSKQFERDGAFKVESVAEMQSNNAKIDLPSSPLVLENETRKSNDGEVTSIYTPDKDTNSINPESFNASFFSSWKSTSFTQPFANEIPVTKANSDTGSSKPKSIANEKVEPQLALTPSTITAPFWPAKPEKQTRSSGKRKCRHKRKPCRCDKEADNPKCAIHGESSHSENQELSISHLENITPVSLVTQNNDGQTSTAEFQKVKKDLEDNEPKVTLREQAYVDLNKNAVSDRGSDNFQCNSDIKVGNTKVDGCKLFPPEKGMKNETQPAVTISVCHEADKSEQIFENEALNVFNTISKLDANEPIISEVKLPLKRENDSVEKQLDKPAEERACEKDMNQGKHTLKNGKGMRDWHKAGEDHILSIVNTTEQIQSSRGQANNQRSSVNEYVRSKIDTITEQEGVGIARELSNHVSEKDKQEKASESRYKKNIKAGRLKINRESKEVVEKCKTVFSNHFSKSKLMSKEVKETEKIESKMSEASNLSSCDLKAVDENEAANLTRRFASVGVATENQRPKKCVCEADKKDAEKESSKSGLGDVESEENDKNGCKCQKVLEKASEKSKTMEKEQQTIDHSTSMRQTNASITGTTSPTTNVPTTNVFTISVPTSLSLPSSMRNYGGSRLTAKAKLVCPHKKQLPVKGTPVNVSFDGGKTFTLANIIEIRGGNKPSSDTNEKDNLEPGKESQTSTESQSHPSLDAALRTNGAKGEAGKKNKEKTSDTPITADAFLSDITMPEKASSGKENLDKCEKMSVKKKLYMVKKKKESKSDKLSSEDSSDEKGDTDSVSNEGAKKNSDGLEEKRDKKLRRSSRFHDKLDLKPYSHQSDEQFRIDDKGNIATGLTPENIVDSLFPPSDDDDVGDLPNDPNFVLVNSEEQGKTEKKKALSSRKGASEMSNIIEKKLETGIANDNTKKTDNIKKTTQTSKDEMFDCCDIHKDLFCPKCLPFREVEGLWPVSARAKEVNSAWREFIKKCDKHGLSKCTECQNITVELNRLENFESDKVNGLRREGTKLQSKCPESIDESVVCSGLEKNAIKDFEEKDKSKAETQGGVDKSSKDKKPEDIVEEVKNEYSNNENQRNKVISKGEVKSDGGEVKAKRNGAIRKLRGNRDDSLGKVEKNTARNEPVAEKKDPCVVGKYSTSHAESNELVASKENATTLMPNDNMKNNTVKNQKANKPKEIATETGKAAKAKDNRPQVNQSSSETLKKRKHKEQTSQNEQTSQKQGRDETKKVNKDAAKFELPFVTCVIHGRMRCGTCKPFYEAEGAWPKWKRRGEVQFRWENEDESRIYRKRAKCRIHLKCHCPKCLPFKSKKGLWPSYLEKDLVERNYQKMLKEKKENAESYHEIKGSPSLKRGKKSQRKDDNIKERADRMRRREKRIDNEECIAKLHIDTKERVDKQKMKEKRIDNGKSIKIEGKVNDKGDESDKTAHRKRKRPNVVDAKGINEKDGKNELAKNEEDLKETKSHSSKSKRNKTDRTSQENSPVKDDHKKCDDDKKVKKIGKWRRMINAKFKKKDTCIVHGVYLCIKCFEVRMELGAWPTDRKFVLKNFGRRAREKQMLTENWPDCLIHTSRLCVKCFNFWKQKRMVPTQAESEEVERLFSNLKEQYGNKRCKVHDLQFCSSCLPILIVEGRYPSKSDQLKSIYSWKVFEGMVKQDPSFEEENVLSEAELRRMIRQRLSRSEPGILRNSKAKSYERRDELKEGERKETGTFVKTGKGERSVAKPKTKLKRSQRIPKIFYCSLHRVFPCFICMPNFVQDGCWPSKDKRDAIDLEWPKERKDGVKCEEHGKLFCRRCTKLPELFKKFAEPGVTDVFQNIVIQNSNSGRIAVKGLESNSIEGKNCNSIEGKKKDSFVKKKVESDSLPESWEEEAVLSVSFSGRVRNKVSRPGTVDISKLADDFMDSGSTEEDLIDGKSEDLKKIKEDEKVVEPIKKKRGRPRKRPLEDERDPVPKKKIKSLLIEKIRSGSLKIINVDDLREQLNSEKTRDPSPSHLEYVEFLENAEKMDVKYFAISADEKYPSKQTQKTAVKVKEEETREPNSTETVTKEIECPFNEALADNVKLENEEEGASVDTVRGSVESGVAKESENGIRKEGITPSKMGRMSQWSEKDVELIIKKVEKAAEAAKQMKEAASQKQKYKRSKKPLTVAQVLAIKRNKSADAIPVIDESLKEDLEKMMVEAQNRNVDLITVLEEAVKIRNKEEFKKLRTRNMASHKVEMFLQENPCDQTPKLPKCRDCRVIDKRDADQHAFCRFVMFRRLARKLKTGKLESAGFCSPKVATADTFGPWISAAEDVKMKAKVCHYIIQDIAGQFCAVVEEECRALLLGTKDGAVGWKRAVAGVREMCDACATTIFNIHWVCEKCGFCVCLDCYKSKLCEQEVKDEGSKAFEFHWYSCAPGLAHKPRNLTVTQIIPKDALWDLCTETIDICTKMDIPFKLSENVLKLAMPFHNTDIETVHEALKPSPEAEKRDFDQAATFPPISIGDSIVYDNITPSNCPPLASGLVASEEGKPFIGDGEPSTLSQIQSSADIKINFNKAEMDTKSGHDSHSSRTQTFTELRVVESSENVNFSKSLNDDVENSIALPSPAMDTSGIVHETAFVEERRQKTSEEERKESIVPSTLLINTQANEIRQNDQMKNIGSAAENVNESTLVKDESPCFPPNILERIPGKANLNIEETNFQPIKPIVKVVVEGKGNISTDKTAYEYYKTVCEKALGVVQSIRKWKEKSKDMGQSRKFFDHDDESVEESKNLSQEVTGDIPLTDGEPNSESSGAKTSVNNATFGWSVPAENSELSGPSLSNGVAIVKMEEESVSLADSMAECSENVPNNLDILAMVASGFLDSSNDQRESMAKSISPDSEPKIQSLAPLFPPDRKVASYLCDGRLLQLNYSRHPENVKLFRKVWKKGFPLIVSGVDELLDKTLWKPESFAAEFGSEIVDVVNCRNGQIIRQCSVGDFWKGFESVKDRPVDSQDLPMLLKLKDWPPGDDFRDKMPRRFEDLMNAIPLPDYTRRDGHWNLVSRLPTNHFIKPDLGPKMYNAYGSAAVPSAGTTNLHLDMSDAVNVMVYVGVPRDPLLGEQEIEDALKTVDIACCEKTKERVRQPKVLPGALWHIYAAEDADKIRKFLRKVAEEKKLKYSVNNDPIHDQCFYLDHELRKRLKAEYGVTGFAICQCLGDAVFIPAGAPHQVLNLHSCVKVAEDFVSPERIGQCFNLTQEFRYLSDRHTNHEDKLQVKNIIYHAVKDSVAVLKESLRWQPVQQTDAP